MTVPVESERWEQLWLPLWPLASDDFLAGVYRGSRERALGLRYIEANPQALSNLLVVDIDHPDALMRTLWDRKGLYPNVVVENPTNGHAHAIWALEEPVTRTEYARRKPLAYAAAVTEGLRRSVDGDAGYSGLITKNPLHGSWESHLLNDELFTLAQLERQLEEFMPTPSWVKARRKDPVGLGRNCSLFETARVWAYREARRIRAKNEYPSAQDSAELATVLARIVTDLNAGFSEQLPANEAKDIALSIHKWITTKFHGWTDSRTVNEATFAAIQSARGRKSGKARETRSQGIRSEVLKGFQL